MRERNDGSRNLNSKKGRARKDNHAGKLFLY